MRTRNLIAVFCALYLSGAHWMLVKTTAWTSMLLTRSQEGTFVEAVKTTFDGEHPCAMCELVTKGQADDKKPDVPRVQKVPEVSMLVCLGAQLPEPDCVELAVWPHVPEVYIGRSDAPPDRPPLA